MCPLNYPSSVQAPPHLTQGVATHLPTPKPKPSSQAPRDELSFWCATECLSQIGNDHRATPGVNRPDCDPTTLPIDPEPVTLCPPLLVRRTQYANLSSNSSTCQLFSILAAPSSHVFITKRRQKHKVCMRQSPMWQDRGNLACLGSHPPL